jgi:hypothetical protein
MRGGRRIRGRRIATLTLRNIKERLIDWFGWIQVTIDRDLHVYRQLDIDLFKNQRILTKYGEKLYSDSGLICKNWTLRFLKLEPPVLQLGAFSKCHNLLARAPNHALCISVLIISTRASLWRLQIFSLSSSSYSLKNFFVSWVKFNQIIQETRA